MSLLIKGAKKALLRGGKIAGTYIAPDLMNFAAKMGNDLLEKQKNLVKIPDLKNVRMDEAFRILVDDLNLIPIPSIAKPSIAYAEERENDVVYSQPRFGSRVSPRTTVKVYYLTQEVVDESKQMLENEVKQFKAPVVVGGNIYEAREDLVELGLKVTQKLEKPNLKYADKEDGQVTRVTYPNHHKIGSKLKTGERICLFYVNEEVIADSKAIKAQKDRNRKEKIEKINEVRNVMSKKIRTGVVDIKTIRKKGRKR